MMPYVNFRPVVQPRPPEMPIINTETQRMDQMKRNLRRPAEPGDIARIGRDLRLIKHDVKRRCLQNTMLAWIHDAHARLMGSKLL